MAVTDEDVLSPEEIEEQRRARIAALAAPSRLQPLGNVRPTMPAPKTVDAEAPRLTPAGSDDAHSGDLAPQSRLKPLSYQERQRLSTISPGVEAGSSGQYRSEIARDEDAKQNPWGSKDNHPGFAGRLAHIAAKVGNIAGDVVAPATMSMIPGTDLNKQYNERRSQENLEAEQTKDIAEEGEKNRAAHEENVESSNDLKYKQDQEKIDETKRKDDNTYSTGLRKQGYELGPDGKPVPLTYENMSPVEQAHFDLSTSTSELKAAQAEFEKTKADPNSVQNKLAKQRVQTAIQNASTAAQRLGLSKDEFRAKYLGVDPEGNQLAGTQTDQTSGKPIGPSVANASKGALEQLNKNYVKPANDVEKSYQMFQSAFKEYNDAKARGEDLPTGAQSMLALSTHLATTFGNVKGARITKDMIAEHLGARSISDSMLVAVQRFTNGDVLSPDQWSAFSKLMGESRGLSWQTATKEAKRANLPVDFLPEDLQQKSGAQQKPNAAQGGFKVPDDAPKAPAQDGHKLKAGGKVIAVSKGGQWQHP